MSTRAQRWAPALTCWLSPAARGSSWGAGGQRTRRLQGRRPMQQHSSLGVRVGSCLHHRRSQKRGLRGTKLLAAQPTWVRLHCMLLAKIQPARRCMSLRAGATLRCGCCALSWAQCPGCQASRHQSSLQRWHGCTAAVSSSTCRSCAAATRRGTGRGSWGGACWQQSGQVPGSPAGGTRCCRSLAPRPHQAAAHRQMAMHD
mmetsp:Transcript_19939/g.50578  ORF Transcript_19939/g.50578 Transcript_19939/m.50578 type:complete len:201 (-) Transcript_19939:262-864(-)